MNLGLINSAFAQAGKGTQFGLEQTKAIGFDTVDIFADPLDIDVDSVGEAFDRYLASGRPGFVPRTKNLPEDAIALIRGSGGVPVLAHPLTADRGVGHVQRGHRVTVALVVDLGGLHLGRADGGCRWFAR